MCPRRCLSHGAPKAMWLSFPMSVLVSLTLKERRWGPQVVWRRMTVARMNSVHMLTVKCCRLRTRPRIMLVGATNSLWSLSHEMGSFRSVELDSPSNMKTALMLEAIACSKRWVLATSR